MSISIQGSAAALATLESLTTQAGQAAGANPNPPLPDAPGAPDAASVVDLSGAGLTGGGPSVSLATSASIADAAVSAGSLIESLLVQMRQDALTASDATLGSDSRAALSQGFRDNLSQIQQAIAAAGVAGVNLLDGSVDGASEIGSATLTGVDLSLGGPVIGVGADASLADPAGAAALAGQLGASIDKVSLAIGAISAEGQAIEGHLQLVAQASLSGLQGQADLDADGARLTALSVQQQLSLTSSGIANQAPNAILSLFQAA
jgi:flagellin